MYIRLLGSCLRNLHIPMMCTHLQIFNFCSADAERYLRRAVCAGKVFITGVRQLISVAVPVSDLLYGRTMEILLVILPPWARFRDYTYTFFRA